LIFIDPAVYSFLRNTKLTSEDMESWTKYHVRSKSIRYCDKHISHFEKEGELLDKKRECVSNIYEYLLLKGSIEREEFFLGRNIPSEDFSRLRETVDNKRGRIKELRESTRPLLTHNGETVSFDSEMPMVEKMQNTLGRDKYNISRTLSSYKRMKDQLERALSQLGLTNEFAMYENEAYSTLDRRTLSVYNILERMYPLYSKDDE
jgi:hypothetical protein